MNVSDSVGNFALFCFMHFVNSFQVYWEIRSESDITGDFLRTEGSVVIADQQSTAEIIIYLLPDDVPELDENYVVQLVSVEGGADLDQEKRISKMNVFANDDPHGVFALYSDQQSVLVERNLDRYVQINVTRHAGAFGEVIVEYHILSHHEEALIAPENEVGYLTVKDGASFGVKRVPIHSQVCIILSVPMRSVVSPCVHCNTNVLEEDTKLNCIHCEEVSAEKRVLVIQISYLWNRTGFKHHIFR